MSFVLVSADCTCCKPEGRMEVYQQLADIGWRRLSGNANEPVSIWLGWLTPDVPEEEAMAIAKEKFYSCFSPNRRPSIVFHWGTSEPAPASVA